MPAAVPALIAGAAAATSVTAAGAIAFSVGTFALVSAGSFALQTLSSALTPKPKKNSGGIGGQSQTLNFTQPVTNHMLVYGQTIVGGPRIFMSSTGNNEYLHIIIALACHELESIDEVWVNDDVISNDWLDTNGNVTQGKYKDYLRIRKWLGTASQSADPMMVAEIPEWTVNHRGQGIAYLYCRLRYNQDIYTGGLPNFSAVVKGRKIEDPRTGTIGWSPNLALIWNDYVSDASYGPAAVQEDLNDTNIISTANICDEMVAISALDTAITSIATSTDIITLTGDRLKYELGDRIQIVTTGTAPGGLSTGVNYYVIPYQYKGTPRIKLATSLANAIAGTAIDITSSGTGTNTVRKNAEPRYHGAGVMDTGNVIKDNISAILTGMGASMPYPGGVYYLKPAIWTAPVLTLDQGDMLGEINVETRRSRQERFNIVKGQFVSALNDFQPQDYPQQTNQSYIDEDMLEIPYEFNLQFTNRANTAQRIALVELFRGRQEISGSCTFDMKAFQLQAGDNFGITLARLGWEDKYFEVKDCSITTGGVDNPNIVMNVSFKETAEAVFDWTAQLSTQVDPAPNSNLPNPFNVAVPTGVGYSSRAVETLAADQLFNLVLQWDQHPDAFVREGGFFEIQFRRSDEADWRPSFRVSGDSTFADIIQTSVNINYDIRIRAVNNLAFRSNWVTIYNAVAGSSGGVTGTYDWETFSDPVGSGLEEDWATFGDPVPSGNNADWGYFT